MYACGDDVGVCILLIDMCFFFFDTYVCGMCLCFFQYMLLLTNIPVSLSRTYF